MRLHVLWPCVAALLMLGNAQERRAEGLAGPDFFRPFQLRQVRVSPDGSYLARLLQDERHYVSIDHRSGAVAEAVFSTDVDIEGIHWADDDTLLVIYLAGSSTGERQTRIIDLELTGERILADERGLGEPGRLVHALPHEADTILYSPAHSADAVYRVDLRRTVPGDSAPFGEAELVARLPEAGARWVTDRAGVVRAAITASGGRTVASSLWYRASGEAPWRELIRSGSDLDVVPLGFASPDRLLVASDRDRDTFALWEFDPEAVALTRLVYEHPTAQVESVVFDYDGELLAAIYLEGGVGRLHYFWGPEAGLDEKLGRAFPGLDIKVTSVSRGRKIMSLLVARRGTPGAFYWFDTETGALRKIGPVAPWLPAERLAPVEVFRARSADGLEVESFLTRPLGVEQPPLVVIPHGGPVGARDQARFDPLGQYLAHAGFAVLEVNYRGSGGYGKAFERAGEREWGARIEDDVDAAIRHVVQRGWVDAERMCIAGSSYGGYSALMSAIRWPGRFRCAATLAGVSDIALLFNSSAFAMDDRGREQFAELTGDPREDYDAMRAASPLYRAAEIAVPVFIAHGEDDLRVDVEHAYRLRAMLEVHGAPYDWLLLRGSGHGFTDRAQALAYYAALRGFLERHLGIAKN